MMRNLTMALMGAVVSVACAAEPAVETAALTVGQSWSVTLPGNPTTGFVWQVAECPEVVQVNLAFEASKPAPGERPLCGRPCGTVVTLTGLKAGQGTVKLIYSRPWEKETAPLTRTITVTVK